MRINIKKSILYFWLALTIVFGREIYANYDLFNIPGLKWNHLFSIIVLIVFFKKFLKKNTPDLSYIYGIVVLSLISFYLGYVQGNTGVFFNLNYTLGILFYVVGYHSLDSSSDYSKLLKYFTLLFFITYIYKEIQFTLGGASLLFSFDEIRKIRDLNGIFLVKGSSDTISTIGSVVLIFFLTNKLKYRYVYLFFISWILLRYGVRTPILSILIAYLVWNYGKAIFQSRYYIYFIFGGVLFLLSRIDIQSYFISFINFFQENSLDTRQTFIWRVAMWIDSIQTVINQGFYWIGISGKAIDFNLVNLLNFRAYVNPHNSYIYILLNFGILNILLLLVLIFKTLRLKSDQSYNNLFKASYFSIVMFTVYANGSPVLELIYQAPLFWFLIGTHRKLTLFHYQEKN